MKTKRKSDTNCIFLLYLLIASILILSKCDSNSEPDITFRYTCANEEIIDGKRIVKIFVSSLSEKREPTNNFKITVSDENGQNLQDIICNEFIIEANGNNLIECEAVISIEKPYLYFSVESSTVPLAIKSELVPCPTPLPKLNFISACGEIGNYLKDPSSYGAYVLYLDVSTDENI